MAMVLLIIWMAVVGNMEEAVNQCNVGVCETEICEFIRFFDGKEKCTRFVRPAHSLYSLIGQTSHGPFLVAVGGERTGTETMARVRTRHKTKRLRK